MDGGVREVDEGGRCHTKPDVKPIFVSLFRSLWNGNSRLRTQSIPFLDSPARLFLVQYVARIEFQTVLWIGRTKRWD